eukprot:Skav232260  [mRNA]  locus=scaffold273:323486:323701:+ [translate_table: standard]
MKEYWTDAEAQVKRTNSDSQSKGKGKGGGKARFDTSRGDYPFEYKLAEVKTGNYDSEVLARQQKAEEDEDM